MVHDKRRFPRDLTLLALTLVLLIPVECLCARAAFETIGEVSSVLYWMAVVGGNGLVLLVALLSRTVATALALLLGLLIVPYQVVLMQRHTLVQEEAARIVAYAYETHQRTGSYPSDLRDYTYQRPETREFIQAYVIGDEYGGFQVDHCVGSPTTSHWYSPKGGWMYYPD